MSSQKSTVCLQCKVKNMVGRISQIYSKDCKFIYGFSDWQILLVFVTVYFDTKKSKWCYLCKKKLRLVHLVGHAYSVCRFVIKIECISCIEQRLMPALLCETHDAISARQKFENTDSKFSILILISNWLNNLEFRDFLDNSKISKKSLNRVISGVL